MSETTATDGVEEAEFGIREVLRIVWGGRWLVVWTSLVCCLLAAVAAFVVPKSYVASSMISPVTTSPTSGSSVSGGLSSLASQFGGLASLAGVSVPGDSKKYESLAVLQSE